MGRKGTQKNPQISNPIITLSLMATQFKCARIYVIPWQGRGGMLDLSHKQICHLTPKIALFLRKGEESQP
jgi:hypothetical protein